MIQPNIILETIPVNTDHCYQIQHQLSDQQRLRYGKIAARILKKIEND